MYTTRNPLAAITTVLALAGLAATANAGVQSLAAKSGSAFTVSGSDLLQTNFGSVTAVNLEANAAEPIVRNGAFDTATGANDRATAGAGRFIEYQLNTSINTAGYNLTSIETFAQWGAGSGGRSSQGYRVSVSYVSAPTTFFDLTPSLDWTGIILPTDGQFTKVALTNVSGGALATGVSRVRFDFANAAPLSVNMYRELDLFGSATVASATRSIAVLNGSFELNNQDNDTQGGAASELFTSESVPGWTNSGPFNEGVQDVPADKFAQNAGNGFITDPGQQADGDQAAFINTGNTAGSLTSAVAAVYKNQALYDLTVAVGRSLNGSSFTGVYTIELLRNGVTMAANTLNISTIALGDFVDLNVSYLSLAPGGNLQVRLSYNGNAQSFFDNVRLIETTGVPAPAALPAGLALMGVAMMRRRRH